MRMYHRALTVVLFASAALAQTSSIPLSDVPSDAPEHHRLDDDDQPPPPSAASVLPGTPVIVIEGICDQPSGATPSSVQANGQEGSPEAARNESSGSPTGSTRSACKTIVTKAQFEKLVEALDPQMP